MRKLATICTLLLLLACNKGKNEISLKLVPVKQGNYWGYIDKTGKFIINPQFEMAYTFEDGLALVEDSREKFGYIDEKGNFVIPAVYKRATSFAEGAAAVVKENQPIEYIDKQGKTTIRLDTSITRALNFTGGLAMAERGGKTCYIDKTGKIVLTSQQYDLGMFSEDLLWISQKTNDGIRYGFVGRSGKIVITPQFEEPSMFHEGMAAIKLNGKFGFINTSGAIVITPQFDAADGFSGNLAAVELGKLWGFIDKSGKFVINPQYGDRQSFNGDGLCPVLSTINDKWGFIDKTGKMIIEPKYKSVTNFYDGIAVVREDTAYGIIDKEGRYITSPIFKDVHAESTDLYNFLVESDFFDASGIADLLFKHLTDTSIYGYNYNSVYRFVDLQAKFPGLTFNNISNFRGFEEEGNGDIQLSSIDVMETFEMVHTLPNSEFSYDSTAFVPAIMYHYHLKDRANTQHNNIIKALADKLPRNLKVEIPNSNTCIAEGVNFGFVIQIKGDELVLNIPFDPLQMDFMKQNAREGL
ncbi:MAG TPA: WG repeat-containing protein [Chitinophagaceae bacterium]|nr:WG repeat-containing protein [Chitinophagaceae bacterium]